MLVSTGDSLPSSKSQKVLMTIARTISSSIAETDITGWYKTDRVLGVLFTEIAADAKNVVLATLLDRAVCVLRDKLSFQQLHEISISTHTYPEDWEYELLRRPSNPIFYKIYSEPRQISSRPAADEAPDGHFWKRIRAGRFRPPFPVIALAIKLTSKGPVFFKQERNGEYGKPFVFIKFRSMYVNNDIGVHRQWFQPVCVSARRRHTRPTAITMGFLR